MAERASWELGDGYSVRLHDPGSADDCAAVIALWAREGVLSAAERHRRVAEVQALATGPDGAVVGVASVYLDDATQLGPDLWFLRTYVAAAHRRSAVAYALTVLVRGHLSERFTSGQDRRADGIVFQLENTGVDQAFPQAEWHMIDFAYVGDTSFGEPVRVHWFPGALAPPPPPPTASVVPGDGCRIALLAGHPTLAPKDVLAFWEREGAPADAEARRRLPEVLLVAQDPVGDLVGVASVFLAWNAELLAELWHLRTDVSPRHPIGELALGLARTASAHLELRWSARADRRGRGLVTVGVPGPHGQPDDAVCPGAGAFVRRAGPADVRVGYFPGARAPAPP